MNDDLSSKTVCFVDTGLFTELAVRLAPSFGRVLYWSQWEDEFPTVNNRVLGDGIHGITRISDPFDHVDETDLFVFPDIFRSGWQTHLESIGKRVWGGRKGERLELDRVWFRKFQKELGMNVPRHEVVQGISDLRTRLEDSGECYVKCSSRIRGSWETYHHYDFEQSEYFLDKKTVDLGGSKEQVKFLIEWPLDSTIETGGDTYCIDGEFPDTQLQGYEIKSKLILCSVNPRSELPEEVRECMEPLRGFLKEQRYRNFMSAEVKVETDGEINKAYALDPCCRCPNPGIGVEMEMIANLPEIIWHGAAGEMVQPVMEYQFGIQAGLFHEHDKELWKQFRIPHEIKRWVKLMEFCKKDEEDDLWQIVPRPPHGEKIGWIIGVGNTIKEAARHVHGIAEAFKGTHVEARLESLKEAIEEIHEAESEGIEFTDQSVPEPESVVK